MRGWLRAICEKDGGKVKMDKVRKHLLSFDYV